MASSFYFLLNVVGLSINCLVLLCKSDKETLFLDHNIYLYQNHTLRKYISERKKINIWSYEWILMYIVTRMYLFYRIVKIPLCLQKMLLLLVSFEAQDVWSETKLKNRRRWIW